MADTSEDRVPVSARVSPDVAEQVEYYQEVEGYDTRTDALEQLLRDGLAEKGLGLDDDEAAEQENERGKLAFLGSIGEPVIDDPDTVVERLVGLDRLGWVFLFLVVAMGTGIFAGYHLLGAAGVVSALTPTGTIILMGGFLSLTWLAVGCFFLSSVALIAVATPDSADGPLAWLVGRVGR